MQTNFYPFNSNFMANFLHVCHAFGIRNRLSLISQDFDIPPSYSEEIYSHYILQKFRKINAFSIQITYTLGAVFKKYFPNESKFHISSHCASLEYLKLKPVATSKGKKLSYYCTQKQETANIFNFLLIELNCYSLIQLYLNICNTNRI